MNEIKSPRTVGEAVAMAGDLISLAWAAGDDDEQAAVLVCNEFEWTCFPSAQLVVALHRAQCAARGERVGVSEEWP